MKLSGYIGGIIGLTKDLIRFCLALLKRPHYVAVLIMLFLGVFYLYGVSPQEIPQVVGGKWQAFIADRKKVVSEELQSISERIDDKDSPLKQTINRLSGHIETKAESKKDVQPSAVTDVSPVSKQQHYLFEEKFGWQQAMASAEDELPDLSEKEVVRGVISVIGADKVRIADRTFSLKVKLRPGKAAEAFPRLKRRFDGLNAKCFPDPGNPDMADCIVGALGVSELLIDFGYADPL